jgi:hypothetical protein
MANQGNEGPNHLMSPLWAIFQQIFFDCLHKFSYQTIFL